MISCLCTVTTAHTALYRRCSDMKNFCFTPFLSSSSATSFKAVYVHPSFFGLPLINKTFIIPPFLPFWHLWFCKFVNNCILPILCGKVNGLWQTSDYILNKSACEPVSTKVRVRTSFSFKYISNQSGWIWHSLNPWYFPFNSWSRYFSSNGIFFCNIVTTSSNNSKFKPLLFASLRLS